jgi:N-methylhydantoinase A
MLPTQVYDGRALGAGQTIIGPAVIDEDTTTILLGPGDRLRVTDAANYLIEIN